MRESEEKKNMWRIKQKTKGYLWTCSAGWTFFVVKRTRKTERMARTRTLLPILDQRIIGVLEWIPRVDWCGFHSRERPLAPALKVRLPTPWFTGAKTVRYSAEISYQGIPDHLPSSTLLDVTRGLLWSDLGPINLLDSTSVTVILGMKTPTPLPLPSSFPLSLSPSLLSL